MYWWQVQGDNNDEQLNTWNLLLQRLSEFCNFCLCFVAYLLMKANKQCYLLDTWEELWPLIKAWLFLEWDTFKYKYLQFRQIPKTVECIFFYIHNLITWQMSAEKENLIDYIK